MYCRNTTKTLCHDCNLHCSNISILAKKSETFSLVICNISALLFLARSPYSTLSSTSFWFLSMLVYSIRYSILQSVDFHPSMQKQESLHHSHYNQHAYLVLSGRHYFCKLYFTLHNAICNIGIDSYLLYYTDELVQSRAELTKRICFFNAILPCLSLRFCLSSRLLSVSILWTKS